MANEFVTRKGLISLGGIAFPYTAKTATYTTTAEDYFIDCTSGTFTVNLVSGTGKTGFIQVIRNSGAGVITVDPDGSATIGGLSTLTLDPDESVEIIQDGSGNWRIIGISGGSSGSPGTSGTSGTSGGGGGGNLTVTVLTSNTTLTTSVNQILLADTTSGIFTITLPTAVGNPGLAYTIKKINQGNDLTINTTSSQTIDGSTSIVLKVQYTSLDIISNGTNWFIL